MVAAMVTSRICEGYTNDAVDDIDDHAGDAGVAGDHAGDHAGQALPVGPAQLFQTATRQGSKRLSRHAFACDSAAA